MTCYRCPQHISKIMCDCGLVVLVGSQGYWVRHLVVAFPEVIFNVGVICAAFNFALWWKLIRSWDSKCYLLRVDRIWMKYYKVCPPPSINGGKKTPINGFYKWAIWGYSPFKWSYFCVVNFQLVFCLTKLGPAHYFTSGLRHLIASWCNCLPGSLVHLGLWHNCLMGISGIDFNSSLYVAGFIWFMMHMYTMCIYIYTYIYICI